MDAQSDWPFAPDANMTLFVVPTDHMPTCFDKVIIRQQAVCKAHLRSLAEFALFRRFLIHTVCGTQGCTVYTSTANGLMQHVQSNRLLTCSLTPPVVLLTKEKCSYVLFEDEFPYGKAELLL
jgi:hypothetical protein